MKSSTERNFNGPKCTKVTSKWKWLKLRMVYTSCDGGILDAEYKSIEEIESLIKAYDTTTYDFYNNHMFREGDEYAELSVKLSESLEDYKKRNNLWKVSK